MLSEPQDRPETLCRCCNTSLRMHFQPGLGVQPSQWEVTCDNHDCDLFGYTLGLPRYLTMDLTEYLESGKKRSQ